MFAILEPTTSSRRIVRSVLLMIVGCAIAMAEPSSTTSTGSMIAPRAEHTATLLSNGNVLIVGGVSGGLPQTVLASAEIYDPATGAFTGTANMAAARSRHSATLLPDGRVLVAGGSTDCAADIYDPSAGSFTATGQMVADPYAWVQSATLLHSGRVLIAQPTAQIYDPATARFAATAPYAAPAPRYMEGVVLLADGRVLLTGGGDTAGWSELYDPVRDTFSLAGNMNFWGDVYTATLLPSGTVLFVGNDENDGTPADAEVFDPLLVAFTRIHSAAANHEYGNATLLPDGTVLITGGQLPGGNGEFVSEIYVPASGTFSAAGNMVTARHEHTATLLADGTVLIAGGYTSWPSATTSAELYHPAVLTHAPLLSSLSGDEKGQGAIWHATTGAIASADNPAAAGEVLCLYTTSLIAGGVIPPEVYFGGAC